MTRKIADSVLDLIGSTPIVRLRRVVKADGNRGQAIFAVLLLQLDQVRKFLDAGHAGQRPDIDHDDLPLQLADPAGEAVVLDDLDPYFFGRGRRLGLVRCRRRLRQGRLLAGAADRGREKQSRQEHAPAAI